MTVFPALRSTSPGTVHRFPSHCSSGTLTVAVPLENTAVFCRPSQSAEKRNETWITPSMPALRSSASPSSRSRAFWA